MRVAIHCEYLGTHRHLVYDGDTFVWSRDLNGETYTFGSPKGFDLREAIAVSGGEIQTFEDTPHAKAIRHVAGGDVRIPWFHVIPDETFKRLLSRLLDDLWGFVCENMGGYYIETLEANRQLLDRLQRPLVDVPLLKRALRESSPAKSHDIARFLPPKGENEAPEITYNLGGSVTGRLTVSSGPNILTLKRSHRKIMRSRYEGGNIVQADISSLEPRIALAIAGKRAPDDIYSHIGDSLFNGELSRSQAKRAILTCIYGGSSWTLGKSLSSSVDSKRVLRDVKRYFEINGLQRALESEMLEKGFITNAYGRRISSGESIVNHYLQSTGVDVSLEVFRSLLDSLDASGEDYVPIYVIHDAIVLDVSSGALSALREIVGESFQIDKIGCKFPLKVDIIT
jgi:hypothetical protein